MVRLGSTGLSLAQFALLINFEGDLAGIPGICDESAYGKKPAASMEARTERIRMVAGVGFEPTTFRL